MNPPMHRRNFFRAMLLPAFARIAGAADRRTQAFPTEVRKRLAVSSYPFRSLIRGIERDADGMNQAGMTLEQFGATVVSRFGVTGIEPWSHHFESTDAPYVGKLGEAFQKSGVHVVNIAVDVAVHLCDPDAQKRSEGLDQYRKWVDAAVILGSPSIRVHVPTTSEGTNDVQCAVEALKLLAEYAGRKRIVINLENDNPHSEDPFTITEIIKTANSPYLSALPDFCNSMLIADDPAYNHRGLQAMFRYAYNVSHAKDSENDRGKLYTVDMNEIFEIAKKAKYRGYFSMEWEGEGDPYVGTATLIRKSLEGLSR